MYMLLAFHFCSFFPSSSSSWNTPIFFNLAAYRHLLQSSLSFLQSLGKFLIFFNRHFLQSSLSFLICISNIILLDDVYVACFSLLLVSGIKHGFWLVYKVAILWFCDFVILWLFYNSNSTFYGNFHFFYLPKKCRSNNYTNIQFQENIEFKIQE